MNDGLDELFSQLKTVSQPDGLDEGILGAVRRDRRNKRTATAVLYAALVLMAPAMFASVRLLTADLAESPLGSLLKLALTDGREVWSSLGAWSLAVVEFLPVGSLALTVGVLFVVIVLINRITSRGLARNRFMKEAI